MLRSIFTTILLAGLTLGAVAQKADTVKVKNPQEQINHRKDSVTSKPFVPKAPSKVKVYRPDSTHSPSLAVKRSAMIPGWGQVYNHRWWKVPFIYGGLGALGYNLVVNRQDYKMFLAIAKYRQRGTAPAENEAYYKEYNSYSRVQDQGIIDAKDNANRNFQICILSIAVVWGVQMVDAYIDSKFIHSYTMDDNLGFKIAPTLIGDPMYASNNFNNFTPALKVTLTF
ncbi:hypothetical protein KHS38_07295 [Mucilaginibacter sp. Bleaf8]|uniref:DUF5683 domain-containing protein n=1 Tax=Mucilaginibacter sp. Bleaf8 TaxID=2834430 RepID=UPI001BCE9D4F|nr:DUF5683 domain-containing protein [Mucilaginibacter sp. Bleaf8]MBS7564207.1 hypothetical protein [Mucilaginibacter sp. Bleaf8]